MAFNKIMQFATAKIRKELPANPTVVEWGNQRFRYDQSWVRKCSDESGRKIREPVQYTWEFFEDLGFSDYKAIDLNNELRAIPMDLNYVLADCYDYHEQFDLVTNNGTGEHIFDQRAVFENMHNLCKVGGVMLNVLPFGPWVNHGFYNYHPILFRDIAAANNYKWCFIWVASNTGNYENFNTDDSSDMWYEQKKPRRPISVLESSFDRMSKVGTPKPENVSLVTAYKKVNSELFQNPLQGRYVNDATDDIKSMYKNNDTRQKDHTSAGY